MSRDVIDLRSDTITLPTEAMRKAMAEAAVGDDVFGEDPTVRRLEQRLAEMLGKQAALFVPSGTMSNQIAVRLHCGRGEEFLCEATCHIYAYEQAGYAQLSGASARPIAGERGVLTRRQLESHLRGEDIHFPRTRLVCLENTHNRSGGRVLPFDEVQAIATWAGEHGLAMHLDGARLFNAVVATGIEAPRWAALFDTVSVCFSKGLGAPVGSALCGDRDAIEEARRHRKVLGGGMRQAGIIAAGALYALEHHVERLAEDHATARQLAEAVAHIDRLHICPDDVQTNIVLFDVDPALGTAAELAGRLDEAGLRMLAIGPQQIRAVTHLGISEDDIRRGIEILRREVSAAHTGPAGNAKRSTYAG